MQKRYGVTPTDHLFVLNAGSENEHTPDSVEFVVPVDCRDADTLITRSQGRLTRCTLPAFPCMASTLHHRHPSLAVQAYQELGSWMEHTGCAIVGPPREIRLRRVEILDDALTEIEAPVGTVA